MTKRRGPRINVTATVTFAVDEATGDVVALAGGREHARFYRADLYHQDRLQTWKRKAWITDDFMLAVLRARGASKT